MELIVRVNYVITVASTTLIIDDIFGKSGIIELWHIVLKRFDERFRLFWALFSQISILFIHSMLDRLALVLICHSLSPNFQKILAS